MTPGKPSTRNAGGQSLGLPARPKALPKFRVGPAPSARTSGTALARRATPPEKYVRQVHYALNGASRLLPSVPGRRAGYGPPMLNVRQIEAFKAVIETGTVSRAAARLCVSQPAISKLIQHLEQDTGLELFERSPGRIRPTGDALLLFEEISRLYRGLERLETAAFDIRNSNGTMLTIGVMPALSTGFIQDLIVEYQTANSSARVALHARSTMKIADMLISGGLDIGLSSHPVDDPEIELIPLDRRPYVCVMPHGHPLAARAALTPQDLAGIRFINFTPTSDVRAQIDEIFSSAGVQRDIVTEASMAPSICAMVARGSGVALLNPLYLGAFTELVTCRPFTPTVSSEVSLLLSRHRPRTSQVARFIDLARAHAESLSPALGTPLPGTGRVTATS